MQDTSILNLFNQLTDSKKNDLTEKYVGIFNLMNLSNPRIMRSVPSVESKNLKSLNVDFLMGNNGFNV